MEVGVRKDEQHENNKIYNLKIKKNRRQRICRQKMLKHIKAKFIWMTNEVYMRFENQ